MQQETTKVTINKSWFYSYSCCETGLSREICSGPEVSPAASGVCVYVRRRHSRAQQPSSGTWSPGKEFQPETNAEHSRTLPSFWGWKKGKRIVQYIISSSLRRGQALQIAWSLLNSALNLPCDWCGNGNSLPQADVGLTEDMWQTDTVLYVDAAKMESGICVNGIIFYYCCVEGVWTQSKKSHLSHLSLLH